MVWCYAKRGWNGSIGTKWDLWSQLKLNGSIGKGKAISPLIAKGFLQKEGIEYKGKFSPIVKHTSVAWKLFIFHFIEDGRSNSLTYGGVQFSTF